MNRVVLCGAVVLAGAAMPSAAHATYPGAKGSISFVDDDFGSGGGYMDLVRLSSKSKRQPSLIRCQYVTFEGRSGCPSSGASFSRHGTRVAFAIDHRLAVAAADGNGLVLRPKLTESDDDFAWTRGSRLVFTGLKAGKRNLYSVNANGTGLRKITSRGGSGPACSNRGLIAYSVNGVLHVVKADGTKDRRIARGINPDFSPSGRTIVYERHGRLFTIQVRKGRKRHRLGRRGADPVFSPDGKQILYVGPEPGSDEDLLYTVSPRGKKRRTIYNPLTGAMEERHLRYPAWQAVSPGR